MAIRPDISRIKDERTRSEINLILEKLREIKEILLAEMPESKLRTITETLPATLECLYANFDDSILITEANFAIIEDAVRNDITSLNDIFSRKLSVQRKRYYDAYKKINDRYGIYPSRIEKRKTDVQLSTLAFSLLHRIDNTSLVKDSTYWTDYRGSLEEFVDSFHAAMRGLWKDIQEIEKYHNDNRRYTIAMLALFISALAFLFSQFKAAYESAQLLISLF